MIEIPLPAAVSLVLAFLGCMFAFGKILLAQFDRRIADRFSAQDKAWDLQLDALKTRQAEENIQLAHLREKLDDLSRVLPLEYVRREDHIRFSAVIDHKLDRLAELVMQTRGNSNARN